MTERRRPSPRWASTWYFAAPFDRDHVTTTRLCESLRAWRRWGRLGLAGGLTEYAATSRFLTRNPSWSVTTATIWRVPPGPKTGVNGTLAHITGTPSTVARF